ncbi:hypothetical protein AAU61_03285 [Desulfocarbo indianensis]|nr:hypothetical protein AAU61_03285 [Desulfocarbo indianensis]
MAKKTAYILIALLLGLPYLTSPAPAAEPDIARLLKGFDACLLVYDLQRDSYVCQLNPALAGQRYSPCSTFKIPHALIGLDLGILKDGDTSFQWDGSPQAYPHWQKDHTLRSAMAGSVVWYFQRLAGKIGPRDMARYLAEFSYGNQDSSGGLEIFWLSSSLKISPREQIAFLSKLYREELPVSPKAMLAVKDVILLDKSGEALLRGKTGSDRIAGKWVLGWFVGWVERPQGVYIFAALLRGADQAYGPRAKRITLQALRELGLW